MSFAETDRTQHDLDLISSSVFLVDDNDNENENDEFNFNFSQRQRKLKRKSGNLTITE